uniref:Uncharacterized protein n=1 Tax=Myoviridae sp. ct1IL4 TaxID=2825019 RepID=A0A8S5Q6A0_9CAUD|nr:MAG TPA: hypothetical protein [Myoviridae sp. ct1IL4]
MSLFVLHTSPTLHPSNLLIFLLYGHFPYQ